MDSCDLELVESDDAKRIREEWLREYHRHPSFGEGKNNSDMVSIWNNAADTYSDESYRLIKAEILDNLYYRGIVRPDRTVLDIGSGPGTYSKPLSRISRSVLALDASPKMLDRLRRECENEGIENVSRVWADCLEIPDGCVSDIAFCSLCPPMNTPESVLSMEKYAREYCVYISSANVVPTLETEVWKALGKDYSYGGYNTQYPNDYLKAVGRSPTLDFFTEEFEQVEPTERVVARYISKVSKYRDISYFDRRRIEETVRKHDENGVVIQKNSMRLGLLCWKPLGT